LGQILPQPFLKVGPNLTPTFKKGWAKSYPVFATLFLKAVFATLFLKAVFATLFSKVI
jgi:hypothetical protein